MDWIIAVFVAPEVLVLLLGFIAIIVSLVGGGELQKLKPLYKPRGSEVDPTYWGQYVKEMKEPESSQKSNRVVAAATTYVIALPTLVKAPEPARWEKDWTGSPQ